MSPLSFYIDHDVSKKARINAFRQAKFDIKTAHEVGNRNASDPEQLLWSFQNKRVIITGNQCDFCELHSKYLTEERIHFGIIIVKRRAFTHSQEVEALLKISELYSSEDMVNQLLFMSKFVY